MPVGSSKDLDPVEPVVCAFDLDNFYVACERLRDPSLIGLPVGIQQKVSLVCCGGDCDLLDPLSFAWRLFCFFLLQNILATCSYEARASVE